MGFHGTVRAFIGFLVLGLGARVGQAQSVTIREYPLPVLSHPHDVAPAPDGGVWYTPQLAGGLGRLDPVTGATTRIPFGPGSSPHGVVVAPDASVWVTDQGLNAVVRVDPSTGAVTRYPLPASAARADLNTAAFDTNGALWFTGQAGWYGRVDRATGEVAVWPAPRGRGPYGMHALGTGPVWFVSLAGGYLGRIDTQDEALTTIDLPADDEGPRRVWLDSRGNPWVTGWYSGRLLRYDVAASRWSVYPVPGDRPQPYAVYVDERDRVWLSDFRANAIHLFDPATGRFTTVPLPTPLAQVRQLGGRPGEVWGAESGANKLIVLRFQ